MKDKEKIFFGAACFFAGAVAGFLISPIKKGIYCGNNSGNTYLGKDKGDDLEQINKELEEVNEEITTINREVNEDSIDSIEK